MDWMIRCIDNNSHRDFLRTRLWLRTNIADLEKTRKRVEHYYSINPEKGGQKIWTLDELDRQMWKISLCEELHIEMIWYLLEIVQLNTTLMLKGRTNGVWQRLLFDQNIIKVMKEEPLLSWFYKGLCLMKLKQRKAAVNCFQIGTRRTYNARRTCPKSSKLATCPKSSKPAWPNMSSQATLFLSMLNFGKANHQESPELDGQDMRKAIDFCPRRDRTEIFDLITKESKYRDVSMFRNSYRISEFFQNGKSGVQLDAEEQNEPEISDEEDELPKESESGAAKSDSSQFDLAKITNCNDEQEEKELKVSSSVLEEVYQMEQNAAEERQKEAKKMQSISINPDVKLIVQEMEVSKEKATRILREHSGNVVNALTSLTN